MTSEAVELLRRLPLFARLNEEVLAMVAERTVFKKLAERAILFRRGEPCQGLYLVAEGRVRVYRANAEGREQVLHTQGPGQPLAEVPLFDAGPYPASARALEDSRVLFLPIDQFQSLYRTHPEIADATIRELGRRLRKAVQLIEKVSLKDIPARVSMSLLEYAEAVGALRDGGEFELPRTQEDLAAELATTRESIARSLSRLRREKVIEQQGARVRILDVARLESVAQFGRG